MSAICRLSTFHRTTVPFNSLHSKTRLDHPTFFSRAFSQASPNVRSDKTLTEQGRQTVWLSGNKLKASYDSMRDHLMDLVVNMGLSAVASPILSGTWMVLTEQMLQESPVAMTCLVAGGAYIANQAMEFSRVKQYAKWSVLSDASGPSRYEEINQKVKQIISGNNPKIHLTTSGLKISGTLGDPKQPSQAVEHALLQINSLNRLVIPSCTLDRNAKDCIDFTTERWSTRINFPLAILYLIAMTSKDHKHRRLDDYVVMAASAYTIHDYFSGPSVDEARRKLSSYLEKAETPSEVLRLLINYQDLNGGMSFLTEWAKNVDTLAIRVGRTGSLILYKNRNFSIGGPYPIQQFPSKNLASRIEPVIETSELEETPSPPKSNKFWYYLDQANQEFGPMSYDALQEAWIAGKISLNSYVWNEDLENWIRFEEIEKN
ncbi:MAG TPA: DUF4339 domain-containing protein [Rhabdochlamydiaceae bacterium]|nr:DUF4339 domain-containing protein [Rhabdochlamydiaceae bacterium]